jgi:hypothetical protein
MREAYRRDLVRAPARRQDAGVEGAEDAEDEVVEVDVVVEEAMEVGEEAGEGEDDEVSGRLYKSRRLALTLLAA